MYRSFTSPVVPSVIRVSTNPGQIALTVMPRLPTSRASDLVNPSSPALDAEYAVCPALPRIAAAEATFTTRPQRAFSMRGSARREQRNAPFRLMSTVVFHVSVAYRTASPSLVNPALFTSTPTEPSSASMRSNAAADRVLVGHVDADGQRAAVVRRDLLHDLLGALGGRSGSRSRRPGRPSPGEGTPRGRCRAMPR